MPSRNVIKQYDAETYYHVYNRGVEKRQIFMDREDYAVFLNLLKRYMGPTPTKDDRGREYRWLGDDLEIIAFCLMPNHVHLLVYQKDDIEAMTFLMRSVTGAYTVYFNKKYHRVGSLFQGIYKASAVRDEAYLQHITRYIHLNPVDFLKWEWSSYDAFTGSRDFEWVHPEQVIALDPQSRKRYVAFVGDYKQAHEDLATLEHMLADR